MANSISTHIGTPNSATEAAASFRPYRGNDVKQGKGGYVKIRGIWMTLHENPACGYSVEFLGWGETFGGALSDYPVEEQELLKTTL